MTRPTRKSLFVLRASLSLTATLVAASPALAAGHIIGTVALTTGQPLANASLQFLDAVNAEIGATTTTAFDGSFDSGPLAHGTYRIRVASFPPTSDWCVREYVDQGGAHSDVFAVGSIIEVSDQEDTVIAAQVFSLPSSFCEPSKCVPQSSGFSGVVVDAETLEPLPGIQVRVKDAETALPVTEITTDDSGSFSLKQEGCGLPLSKVRLLDPSGHHLPEYVGASGNDVFDLGAPVDPSQFPAPSLTEDMARTTPAQQIQLLVQQVEQMPLPPHAVQTVVAVLSRAVGLLEDGNPNNDSGACGLLRSFAGQLEGMVATGEMTQAEADSLSACAGEIRVGLGCAP